jgi:Nuclease-related domain
MRVIELSDHPGDMLHDVARQRQAASSRAREAHEQALIEHQAGLRTIQLRREQARREHRWRAWLRLAFAVWAAKRREPRPPPATDRLSDAEQKIKAGIAGEQQVAAELGQALADDWTLLHGYRNRRGEIDHLLLGPGGLFAIEVKNINATVAIDGDHWRADKYDNYGNLVEQRPIADRKGRSPSQQLDEPAAELERFLRQRGQPVPVQRVVVLTHRRSRLGQHRNLTVHVGTSASYVLTLLQTGTGTSTETHLSERQQAELLRLIRRDHDFHTRSARSARSARSRRR